MEDDAVHVPASCGGLGIRLMMFMAALALAGCASVNTPLNAHHALSRGKPGTEYRFASWLAQRPGPIPELVILSFSGGGARAAALAGGVLDALAERDLDRKIALISSTSGGSLTAAVFASAGRPGIKALNEGFLTRNHTVALGQRLAPSLLLPGGENRATSFGHYLDEKILARGSGGQPLTYADLMARWRQEPFILINSTDMGSGRSFEFTQDNFDNLCSDLSKLGVSQAVAASAAFPFLLNPLPLQNHWADRDCSDAVPGGRGLEKLRRAEKEKYSEPEQLGRARYEYSLRNTGNPSAQPRPDRQVAYVHLLDGGLADNLGARAIVRQLHENYATLKAKGVRKILLIQVNARSTDSTEYDLSPKMPSWVDVFWAVAERPMDIASELSSYLSRLYLLNLVSYDAATTVPSERISIYPVDVDFALLDEERTPTRIKAGSIGTNWGLPEGAETVRFLNDVAAELVHQNPCYQSFIAVPPGPGIQDARESCKFVQIVAQSSPASGTTRVAPAMSPPPPPPPPAPAPAPPAATKVTFATDAYFDSGSAVLRPESRQKLDDLLSKLAGVSLEAIIAVGHSDSKENSVPLSTLRAEAVKQYLVAKGVQKDRVYVEGKGSTQPIADNRDGEGRQKNRRVEIEVVGTARRL